MFEQTFKNIDDIFHKDAGCSSELDYTEQSSWMPFLKYLDNLEHEKLLEADLMGKDYQYIIEKALADVTSKPNVDRFSLITADVIRQGGLIGQCWALGVSV